MHQIAQIPPDAKRNTFWRSAATSHARTRNRLGTNHDTEPPSLSLFRPRPPDPSRRDPATGVTLRPSAGRLQRRRKGLSRRRRFARARARRHVGSATQPPSPARPRCVRLHYPPHHQQRSPTPPRLRVPRRHRQRRRRLPARHHQGALAGGQGRRRVWRRRRSRGPRGRARGRVARSVPRDDVSSGWRRSRDGRQLCCLRHGARADQ
jgi:hypothetical protein